jgi:apolipoprotein N-acyltransferase
LFIAFSGSAFIYLTAWHLAHPLLITLLGTGTWYLLLRSGSSTWFFYGFFSGLFWFWWIGISFIHYRMVWMILPVELAIALTYGGLFWLIAKIAFSVQHAQPKGQVPLGYLVFRHGKKAFNTSFISLSLKALGILGVSYVHPFGFDWFKPELMFVGSYLGIQKWQTALILAALVLTIWRKQLRFLPLLLLAFDPHYLCNTPLAGQQEIQLVTTHVPVEEKWEKQKQPEQFAALFKAVDTAIEEKKETVILPESVFPLFLNYEQPLFERLQQRAKQINIVTGALFLDGKTPRNATYIFTRDGRVTVANKVVLVPFGEANPLPDFLSRWVNRIFYDGAVDYQASVGVTDYTIEGVTYRNAICFEATSERLYENAPKQMIVLSNNGWFTPSTEPILQQLLLQYYSLKYGTTIYHAVNMSPSYIIKEGQLLTP